MNNRYTGNKPVKEVFQVIHDTFEKMINEDKNVVYLDADLMGSLKTQDLWEKYPNNVFNTGIQESNMIGVACGMYLNGMKPYVHTFSPFASRRVFDQVFLSIGYAKKGVRIIASDAGIMATHNGGTHMCFEDIAMMRTIPDACIVDVSDPTMCGKFMQLTKDRIGVTYIRTARRDLPDIYLEDEEFEIGKGKVLRNGTDVTIVACGIMVSTAIEAAKVLEKEGISVRVVDIITIKPIDKELILRCANETRAIITAENSNLNGGLGGAIAEILAKEKPTKVAMVGINDEYGCVGVEPFLRQKYGLDKDALIKKVREVLA